MILLSFMWLACDAEAPRAFSFEADRVIRGAEQQCSFGPRVPGTQAHVEARDWIAGQLRELGMEVTLQEFEGELALIGTRETAWNIWALPAGYSVSSDTDMVVLSAHWDTRPYADEEPAGQPSTPFQGANDGAASVSFVLEVLRSIQDKPYANRVAAVFFDAEDSGVGGQMETWCQGSQYAALHPPGWLSRLRFGINIDMVGSPDLRLRKEGFSLESAPDVVHRLWRIGRDLAPDIFVDEARLPVIDDHLAFIREGYAYINLIGLPNPHWHRRSDRPENLSARSLAGVGEVVLEFLDQEFR